MADIILPKLDSKILGLSQWQVPIAKAGYRVYPLDVGGQCRTISGAPSYGTWGLGQFAVSDNVMVAVQTEYGQGKLYVPNTAMTEAITGSGLSAATPENVTAITLDNSITGVAIGDYFLNLGSQTWPTTRDSGSELTLYENSVDASTAISAGYVITGQGGWFEMYFETSKSGKAVDVVITDSSGTPVGAWKHIVLTTTVTQA